MNRTSPALLSCLLLSLTLSAQAPAQPGGVRAGLPTVGDSARPRPLPAEQAFPWFVAAPGGGKLQVTWTPADGHYLYRHAFNFSYQSSPDAEARPLEFTLPEGLRKTDQFFGDIQAYYQPVSARVTLPESASGGVLWIEYQGCADWGFCYPPRRERHDLQPEGAFEADNG